MAKEGKKESKQELKKAEPAQAVSPFAEMEQFFDDYFSRGWFQPFHLTRPSWADLPMPFEGKTPRVDVIDREDEIIVKAEVPGVEKKDLDISVTENSVSIKGSTRHEEKEEKGDYYHCEISSGSFSRVLPLPAEVDAEKARSKFRDGVLELTLPKVKKAKRHTVKVD
ncbi:MAG: Hsp20/alpha crystallin family protein [Gammaproteobacteria bacterium]